MAEAANTQSRFYVGQRVKLTPDGIKAGLHKRYECPECYFDVGKVVQIKEDIGLLVVLCDGDSSNVVHRQEFWQPLI